MSGTRIDLNRPEYRVIIVGVKRVSRIRADYGLNNKTATNLEDSWPRNFTFLHLEERCCAACGRIQERPPDHRRAARWTVHTLRISANSEKVDRIALRSPPALIVRAAVGGRAKIFVFGADGMRCN